MKQRIAVTLIALVLVGCGGTPAATPAPTPAPKPTVAAPASPPASPPAATPATTPAATKPAGGTPVANPAVAAAVADLARQRGVAPAQITITTVEARDWPDAGLGCPEPGRSYAAVITPGYLIVLSVGADTVTYHTNADGSVVRPCDLP